MKLGFDLEEFQPIFGEAKPEFEASATSNGDGVPALTPFLFRRDSIGISGSCSDFMNYVIASLKSKDVKLIMDWQPKLSGVTSAKLIAHKTKGMPLISISLTKLGPSSGSQAVANLSLELYRAYNILQDSFVKVGLNVDLEQERCCQLTQMISAEKEKSQAVKRKLDMMQSDQQRVQKTTGSGNIISPMYSDTSSVTAALNS